MNSKGRIAVVPPRYGADIVGGAEAVLRETAEGLAARGWEVDAITTCARDHFTWANDMPAGVSTVNGVTVRRFPTVPPWDLREKHRLEAAIVRGEKLDIDAQQKWINGGMRVPELYHHLLDHGEDYSAIVFAPYMFWTTYAGGQLLPDRSVLMSCLHDEAFARLEVYAPLFSGSRDIWFLSQPEHDLAHSLFSVGGSHAVTGSGIAVPESYDPEGFRKRHGIEGKFILYAGRREGAKGWENLLEQFSRIVSRTGLDLKIVTFGAGDVNPPAAIANRVVDLGFISESDKNDAYAAASAYIQPSTMESFSRTILESWLAGTLVLANHEGEVVRWHCERSGAGLTYADEFELQECLEFVADCPEDASRIAALGRPYVLDNYTWATILDTLEGRLQEMAG